ncbi:hypothetical protein M9434_004469 [Picochlorum sp. BPE23]|nr:hypothetical protein M9434_004469 [Picochlorum sp. BPE23]
MESTDYVKVQPKKFAPRQGRETAEGRFWRGLKFLEFKKEFGPVSHIDCCSEGTRGYAVTTSTRVHLYDARLNLQRTISRFKDTAYCGTFRSDGKLVAAGGESGIVQVFDANSRSLLRQMTSHSRPVHSVAFAHDKLHLLSAGDDATVRWWDVASGNQISRFDGHTDYVRTAALSPQSEELLATGGYDHMCKLWDVRNRDEVASFDHGLPIESMAFFPSESLIVTAGGQKVCCWDISGRRLLYQFNAHQKTVSVVKMVDADGQLRMITGSLDGHVKVFDPATFKMLYACKYPAPVLSLDVAPGAHDTMAVGLADGTLSFRKRKARAGSKSKGYAPRLTASNYRYFFRNQSMAPSESDVVVSKQKKAALAEHDKLLRKFRYADALDKALAGQRPEVVFAVIEELMTRGGLSSALRGRDEDSLSPLIQFLTKYVQDPRYSKDAIAVCSRILDTYSFPLESADGMNTQENQMMHALHVLLEHAREEVKACHHLLKVKGMVDMLMQAQQQ